MPRLTDQIQYNRSFGEYQASDADESGGTYYYYGFVNKSEGWYILRLKNDNTEFRYVAGDSAYTTAWTDRGSQSYDYFYTIF